MFKSIPVLVAAIAALFAFTASPASAGTYLVTQCSEAEPTSIASWAKFRRGGWRITDRCPAGVTLSAGRSRGSVAGVRTPALPAELAIKRARFTSRGRRVTNARPIARFCVDAPADGPCAGILAQRAVRYARKTYENELRWRGGEAGAKAFELRIRTMKGKPARSRVYLSASNFRFDIVDNAAPQANVKTPDAENGPVFGWTEIQLEASDAGGGIASAEVSVDGGEATTYPQPCDYSSFTPCAKTFVKALPLDTVTLENGPHTVTLRVVDAGGNATTSTASFDVENDIVEPEEPEPELPDPTPSRPGPISYEQSDTCAAVENVSWTYAASGDPSPPAAIRVTFAPVAWNWDFPNNTVDFEPLSESVFELPFGLYEDETEFEAWETVSLTGIGRLVPPLAEGASDIRFVVTIQVVNANGIAGPGRHTSFVQSFCPS